MHTLENGQLCVTISDHGAELSGIFDKKNDREIALDFSYNNRIFHAKYLFLGNDLYITDTLNVIELKDLDMGVLSRLSELLKI